MRKLLILLSFLMLWGMFPTTAQPYKSIFGDPTTKWVFVWNNLPGWFHDTAYIEKDTVVNGINYKKISTYQKQFDGAGGGLVREDTNIGKVWYRSVNMRYPDDTVERLAFRFDLNVGDTFDISNSMLTGGSYPDSFNIVDSVRIINGLKHIYFKGQYSFYNEPFTIIEGVGSNMGILWKHLLPTVMQRQYLLCSYKGGSKTSYENKAFNGICWQYSHVGDIEEDNEGIVIYPMPAREVIHILNTSLNKITKVQIINQVGAILLQANQSEITDINIKGISPGYYYIKMFSANGYVSTKPMIIM